MHTWLVLDRYAPSCWSHAALGKLINEAAHALQLTSTRLPHRTHLHSDSCWRRLWFSLRQWSPSETSCDTPFKSCEIATLLSNTPSPDLEDTVVRGSVAGTATASTAGRPCWRRRRLIACHEPWSPVDALLLRLVDEAVAASTRLLREEELVFSRSRSPWIFSTDLSEADEIPSSAMATCLRRTPEWPLFSDRTITATTLAAAQTCSLQTCVVLSFISFKFEVDGAVTRQADTGGQANDTLTQRLSSPFRAFEVLQLGLQIWRLEMLDWHGSRTWHSRWCIGRSDRARGSGPRGYARSSESARVYKEGHGVRSHDGTQCRSSFAQASDHHSTKRFQQMTKHSFTTSLT